jgi:transposase InsO family protein
MENFWSTLKIELVYRTSRRTRDEAEDAILEYIDTWYKHPPPPEGTRLPQP